MIERFCHWFLKRLRNFLASFRGCKHRRTKGFAAYYDDDLRISLRLVQCEDCGLAIITEV